MRQPATYLTGLAALSSVVAQSWPNGPFSTAGQYIVNSSNETVKIAGVNWPGHMEVMVPEGLQHQSVEEIVSHITSIGMNGIRLTFAIEMIDQIVDNFGEDITLEQAFAWGLGPKNGSEMLDRVLEHNPSFSKDTTRLEVYDAIAAECERQQVYIHLDNHMSRGTWCCSGTDGNGWWGDRDFDPHNWVRGLAYMAEHGKQWPALVSIALRNEVRKVLEDIYLRDEAYSWNNWYEYMRIGADAVHEANEDLVIVFGGLGYGHQIDPVFTQAPLSPGEKRFERSDFEEYEDKLALEFHNYENTHDNFDLLKWTLYKDGFQGMNGTDAATLDVYPVMLTEFGHPMEEEGYDDSKTYREVLRDYVPDTGAIWFHWVICGDYYFRILRGERRDEEAWGLLNANWTGWRNEEYIENWMIPMIEATLG